MAKPVAPKSIASLTEAELDAIADLALRHLEPFGLQSRGHAFEIRTSEIETLGKRVAERIERRHGLQGLSFLAVQWLVAGGASPGKRAPKKSAPARKAAPAKKPVPGRKKG